MTLRPKIALRAVSVATIAIFLLAPMARAHETNSGGANLAQTLVTHADVAISAAATSHYLTANSHRITAICYNVGTTNGARVGDSAVGAAQGIAMPPASATGYPYISIDNTDDIYIYSASGTTVGCMELVRP
jgi:hypothetical protein